MAVGSRGQAGPGALVDASPFSCLLQELGYVELLEQEEVAAGIAVANEKGEEERASEWPRCTAPSAHPRPSSAGLWRHGCILQPRPLASPAVLQAVSRINAAIRRGTPDRTLEALMEPAAQLPAVHPLAAPLYQHQLALLQRQHPRVGAPLPSGESRRFLHDCGGCGMG